MDVFQGVFGFVAGMCNAPVCCNALNGPVTLSQLLPTRDFGWGLLFVYAEARRFGEEGQEAGVSGAHRNCTTVALLRCEESHNRPMPFRLISVVIHKLVSLCSILYSSHFVNQPEWSTRVVRGVTGLTRRSPTRLKHIHDLLLTQGESKYLCINILYLFSRDHFLNQWWSG